MCEDVRWGDREAGRRNEVPWQDGEGVRLSAPEFLIRLPSRQHQLAKGKDGVKYETKNKSG